MNRILAIPNWSLYDPSLCLSAKACLEASGVFVHYSQGDVDHQRTVIAFSGDQESVFIGMDRLADLLLPHIDLSSQRGVHPRVGALDVAPFVLLEGSESDLVERVITWGEGFARRQHIPVHLYEKAARVGQEFRLPYLRGQFGSIKQLPDFGSRSHPHWGTSIVGVRDFLLATNLLFSTDDVSIAKQIAKEIRIQREAGNPVFQGVRALGFFLESQNLTQLSLNLTQLDQTNFDSVFQSVLDLLFENFPVLIGGTELIGVIRSRDLEGAQLLTFEPSQVVR